jgi:hypothetical protein
MQLLFFLVVLTALSTLSWQARAASVSNAAAASSDSAASSRDVSRQRLSLDRDDLQLLIFDDAWSASAANRSCECASGPVGICMNSTCVCESGSRNSCDSLPPAPNPSGNQGAIIAAIVLSVVFTCCLLAAGAYYWRRRRLRAGAGAQFSSLGSGDSIALDSNAPAPRSADRTKLRDVGTHVAMQPEVSPAVGTREQFVYASEHDPASGSAADDGEGDTEDLLQRSYHRLPPTLNPFQQI